LAALVSESASEQNAGVGVKEDVNVSVHCVACLRFVCVCMCVVDCGVCWLTVHVRMCVCVCV